MEKEHSTPKKRTPNTFLDQLLPITVSLIAIIPSAIIGYLVKDHNIPVHYSHMVAITVVTLAMFNFATVVMMTEYGDSTQKFTVPALTTSTAIIIMFVIAEALNKHVTDLGYQYITPFLFLVNLFVYFAVFKEDDFPLKFYLSLNSIALYILWAMGNAEIIMPLA